MAHDDPSELQAGTAKLHRRPQGPSEAYKRPIMLFVVTEDWYFLSHRMPMARAAQDLGLDVHVACRVGNRGAEIEEAGFTLHGLEWLRRGAIRPWQDLRFVLELARLKRRVRPTVCHFVAIKPIALGLASNALVRSICLCTFAGLGSALTGENTSKGVAHALTITIRVGASVGTTHAVVQNPEDARVVCEVFRFPVERVHLVEGSGIDAADYARHPRERGLHQGVRFAFAGRLIGDKGVRELLLAFAAVRELHPDAELLIIGDADLTNPSSLTRDEAERAGLQPGVRMCGYLSQEEVKQVLGSCDVAVLPSYREGLPRFLLEGAASGLALLASDVPGCRSVVQTAKTGILVRPRSAEDLARGMMLLADDPEMRVRLGQAARDLVQTRFDSSAIEAAIKRVYSELLEDASAL